MFVFIRIIMYFLTNSRPGMFCLMTIWFYELKSLTYSWELIRRVAHQLVISLDVYKCLIKAIITKSVPVCQIAPITRAYGGQVDCLWTITFLFYGIIFRAMPNMAVSCAWMAACARPGCSFPAFMSLTRRHLATMGAKASRALPKMADNQLTMFCVY